MVPEDQGKEKSHRWRCVHGFRFEPREKDLHLLHNYDCAIDFYFLFFLRYLIYVQI